MEKTKENSPQKQNIIFSIVGFVENILLFIACVSVVLMLVAICYGIFAREILNDPVLWTNDFASYLMVYLAFMAAPWVLKEKGHVTVDILTAKLKGLPLRINTIIISIISIFSCAMYFYFSFIITNEYLAKGTVMLQNIPWPKFALYLPITLGSLFLILRFILIIVETITNRENTNQQTSQHTEAF